MRGVLPIFAFVGAVIGVTLLLYDGPPAAQMAIDVCGPNPDSSGTDKLPTRCVTSFVDFQSMEACKAAASEYNAKALADEAQNTDTRKNAKCVLL